MPEKESDFIKQETAAEIPKEIETKIINLGDPKEFQKRIEGLGGKLSQARRLLSDLGYKLKEEDIKAGSWKISLEGFSEGENFLQALNLLGLETKDKDQQTITVFCPEVLPKSTVRFRQDGERITLTVKERRQRGVEVDVRDEVEVCSDSLVTAKTIKETLERLGYQLASQREKYRTSYLLENALVELNEGPKAPPWAEVEAESPEEVMTIVKKLGYTKEDTASISDHDYYQLHGLNDKEIENLKF